MTGKLPKISVIIAARPDSEYISTISALRKVVYPEKLIEVFISFGFSPSRQRNKAVKLATGEILYFLDNDSLIDKMAFKRTVDVFSEKFQQFRNSKSRGFSLIPKFISEYIEKKLFSGIIYKGEIGAVGGPTVWWKKEKIWPRLSHGILESFFAHFLMAARYRPIGTIHRASEKELILCNLAIKREVFNKVKGFNELLYPNEENELLHRIEKNGFQLIYHPGVIAHRHHRENLLEILQTFLHYGRGRMEQIRLEGIFINFIFLVPFFFSVYLIILIFFHPLWFFSPFVFYLFVSFVSAFGFSFRNKEFSLLIFLPLIFFTAHITYSLGTIRGMMTNLKKLRKTNVEIKIKKIKKFNLMWQN